LSATKPSNPDANKDVHLQRTLEAMRRATEEATKGPREARSGRFDWKPKPKAAE
jgi:hypothetical protein